MGEVIREEAAHKIIKVRYDGIEGWIESANIRSTQANELLPAEEEKAIPTSSPLTAEVVKETLTDVERRDIQEMRQKGYSDTELAAYFHDYIDEAKVLAYLQELAAAAKGEEKATLLSSFAGKKTSELRQMAKEMGVSQEQMEAADGKDDIKEALKELMVAQKARPANPAAALDQQLKEEIQEKLDKGNTHDEIIEWFNDDPEVRPHIEGVRAHLDELAVAAKAYISVVDSATGTKAPMPIAAKQVAARDVKNQIAKERNVDADLLQLMRKGQLINDNDYIKDGDTIQMNMASK